MKRETYSENDLWKINTQVNIINAMTNRNVKAVFEKDWNGWYLQDADKTERFSLFGFGCGNTTNQFYNKLYGFTSALQMMHNGIIDWNPDTD